MELDIPRILASLAKQKPNLSFIYNNQDVPIDRVFAYNGGLPIIAKRASTLHDFLFNEPLKISYVPDDQALTGETLKVLPEQHLFVLLMILYDTFEEMSANAGKGPVQL